MRKPRVSKAVKPANAATGSKSTKTIPEQTRQQILDAAWELIADHGRADVGLAEIAALAGVSRQTVFYAFGNRAGVLTAMVRHKDAQTDHVARIRAAIGTPEPTTATILEATEAWLDYVPIIYPVGILLDAASLSDEAAAEAWNDRMVEALLGGLRGLVARVHATAGFAGDPVRVADEVWAQVHPTMWRRLVVECGWTPEEFRESRLRIIRGLVMVSERAHRGATERAPTSRRHRS